MYDYVFQTLLLGGNKVYLSIYLSTFKRASIATYMDCRHNVHPLTYIVYIVRWRSLVCALAGR